MNTFTVIVMFAALGSIVIRGWLAQRQIHHVTVHRDHTPKAFQTSISDANHRKAADYTVAKAKFGLIESGYGTILFFLWTMGGGLSLLDESVKALNLGQLSTGVIFLLLLFLAFTLLDLPFQIYQTFKLEGRFGFNRTTGRLFTIDLFKQLLLGLLIGAPLLLLILWLVGLSGDNWWMVTWLVWSSFSLLMVWAYPTLIAPLFNKFEPLADDDMRQRIEALLNRTGFTSAGIFIMDGSKRSGHGNAYFTGMGKNKRIVFYDTLLKDLDASEVEAVLAHELGHFKLKHVRKRIITMILASFVGLAVLGALANTAWFYSGLGVHSPSLYMALALFLITIPYFMFFLSPLLSWASRRHEFQADQFAVEQVGGQYLVTALVKLYKENANTLTPDTLHSLFYDTHPPAPTRIAHINQAI